MKHVLSIMGRSGDVKVAWETEEAAAVAEAERMFALHAAKGYTAFEIDPVTKESSRVDAFNPEALNTVMVPQIQGG